MVGHKIYNQLNTYTSIAYCYTVMVLQSSCSSMYWMNLVVHDRIIRQADYKIAPIQTSEMQKAGQSW